MVSRSVVQSKSNKIFPISFFILKSETILTSCSITHICYKTRKIYNSHSYRSNEHYSDWNVVYYIRPCTSTDFKLAEGRFYISPELWSRVKDCPHMYPDVTFYFIYRALLVSFRYVELQNIAIFIIFHFQWLSLTFVRRISDNKKHTQYGSPEKFIGSPTVPRKLPHLEVAPMWLYCHYHWM